MSVLRIQLMEMKNAGLMHMSRLSCGVDPQTNQGDCKMTEVNLRNFPGGSRNLSRQIPLGELSLSLKSP